MADVKELRLALVCYGGSSLAIYMHGITKEIHRLVSASAARAAGAEPSGPSERVYDELLEAVSGGEGGVDLRVIVDVISGTSAGGINGIFLAKAIAENRSLDALRDLWFTDGDIDKLVRDIEAAGLLEHVKGVGSFIDHFANAAPWKLRLGAAVLEAAHEPPFRGDMTTWLYDALAGMDEAGPASNAASLMPDGHRLDLFITMTDFYGYPRLVPVGRPAFAGESRHRHSLQFRFESGVVDEFTDNNAGLALAARATSCFPGVFPPVNVPELERLLGKAAVTEAYSTFKRRAFRVYDLSAPQSLEDTYFVDGGVLDNKPFGFAIDTVIHHRPAQSEVIRRLLYIEPDPGALVTETVRHAVPTPPEAILGALSGIPRSEPILDDLLAVVAQNENVERLAATVESSFARVAALLDPVVPVSVLDQPPEDWPWDDWNAAIHELAIGNTGLAYPTYTRGKLNSVVEGFAAGVCSVCAYPPESNHAVLVRAVLVEWAKRRQLLDDPPHEGAGDGSDGRRTDRRPACVPPGVRPRLHAAAPALRDREADRLVRERGRGRLPRAPRPGSRQGNPLRTDHRARRARPTPITAGRTAGGRNSSSEPARDGHVRIRGAQAHRLLRRAQMHRRSRVPRPRRQPTRARQPPWRREGVSLGAPRGLREEPARRADPARNHVRPGTTAGSRRPLPRLPDLGRPPLSDSVGGPTRRG